jgi:hypothetical protein
VVNVSVGTQQTGIQQYGCLDRALYFVFIGWWLGLTWAIIAVLFCASLIAIRWPRCCYLFDGMQQVNIWCLLYPLMIIATASTLNDLTDHLDGIVLGQHRDHRPFLLKGELNTPEAFFAMSNSMVSPPTSRSNSAIRSCSAQLGWAVRSTHQIKHNLRFEFSCKCSSVCHLEPPSWF